MTHMHEATLTFVQTKPHPRTIKLWSHRIVATPEPLPGENRRHIRDILFLEAAIEELQGTLRMLRHRQQRDRLEASEVQKNMPEDVGSLDTSRKGG